MTPDNSPCYAASKLSIVDRYLIAQELFDIRHNNCWHFVRDVWRDLTGDDIGEPELATCAPGEFDEIIDAWRMRFVECDQPKGRTSAIALFLRRGHVPHVGVWFQGRVLHFKRTGVQYDTLRVASAGFPAIKYYLPCQSSTPQKTP